jgi:hypothetical protein
MMGADPTGDPAARTLAGSLASGHPGDWVSFLVL